MLWDVVFEFFVKYIFGGRIGGVEYRGIIGDIYNVNSSLWNTNYSTATFDGFVKTNGTGTTLVMPLGNYLSLIASIISMVVILVLCCMLIKKIYNMCAHIIG